MLSAYLLLLTLGWAALAGCDKGEVGLVNYNPPPSPAPAPPAPPPGPPPPSAWCSDPAATDRDTVLTGVQVGPLIEDWGMAWRQADLVVSGLTADNKDCAKVFVAQQPGGPWYEVAKHFDNVQLRVAFGIFTNTTHTLRIIVEEGQTYITAVDFTRPFAVKVLYKRK